MKVIAIIGKYMYVIALFCIAWAHFRFPNYMMKYLAYPSPSLFVSVVGIIFILVAISLVLGKFDKFALTILGILLIVIGLSCHTLNIFTADNDHVLMIRLMDLFKIFMLAGSAFAMTSIAKDNRIVG